MKRGWLKIIVIDASVEWILLSIASVLYYTLHNEKHI
jgi:hypothetical protein